MDEVLVTVVVPRDMLVRRKVFPICRIAVCIIFLMKISWSSEPCVCGAKLTKGLSRLDAHKTRKDFGFKPSCSSIMMSISIVMFWTLLSPTAIDYVDKHGSYETDNEYTPAPRMNPYKEQLRWKRLHNNILFRMRARI